MNTKERMELAIARYEAEQSRKEGLDGALSAPLAAFAGLFAGTVYVLDRHLASASASTLVGIVAFTTACAVLCSAYLLLRAFWNHKYSFPPLPLDLEAWHKQLVVWEAEERQDRSANPNDHENEAIGTASDVFTAQILQSYGECAADCHSSNKRRATFRFWGVAATVIGYLLLGVALLLQRTQEFAP